MLKILDTDPSNKAINLDTALTPEIGNVSFLSPAHNREKFFSRAYFNDLLNKCLQKTPELYQEGTHLTSHSFRKGYINALWKKKKDLKLIQDVIGHATTAATAHYLEQTPDSEQRSQIEKIELYGELDELGKNKSEN